MRNSWNRFIYAIWSPVYDLLVRVAFLRQARRAAWDRLAVQAGSDVLIVGCGTGADLPLIPPGVRAVGIDLSRAMLAQARRKSVHPATEVELIVADAANLPFGEGRFDAVLLFLIVSVVPDPHACMAEAARVTRTNGRAIVFDKFLADGTVPSWRRRCVNLLTKLFGTDINRQFPPMIRGLDWRVESDEGGLYRHIVLRKVAGRSEPARANERGAGNETDASREA